MIPIAPYNARYGVTLSLPSALGSGSVAQIFEPSMAEEELHALQHSADILKAALARVKLWAFLVILPQRSLADLNRVRYRLAAGSEMSNSLCPLIRDSGFESAAELARSSRRPGAAPEEIAVLPDLSTRAPAVLGTALASTWRMAQRCPKSSRKERR